MMTLLFTIISVVLFFMGASIASFLHVVSERVFIGEDFVFSRSKCMDCSHPLSSFDLIPVFSFLLLKGKCRYCGKPVSFVYPVSEFLLGIFFVLAFFATTNIFFANPNLYIFYLIFLLATISLFYFIAIHDIAYYIIPDLLVYVASGLYFAVLALIYLLSFFGIKFLYYASFSTFFFEHIITAFLLFIFFLSIFYLTKGKGIGGGDVKLSFLIGLILGAEPTIVFLYVAFFTGAVISLLLLLFKIKGIKDSIPFGPFLAFGIIISLLYASEILKTPLFNFITYFGVLL